jgi:recombination associated protein RdgC
MSKWYSNLYAFKLNTKINEDSFKEIENFKIPKIGEVDREVHGWDSVIDDGELHVKTGGSFMLNLRIDKKKVPSSTLKNEVKKRVKKLEAQGGEKINKKAVKEQVEAELMKVAFVESKEIQGYVDSTNKYVVINSNSSKDIDLFTDLLRETLNNDLDIDLIEVDFEITEVLTTWLTEKEAKEPFELGEDCTLNDSMTGSKASFSRQDLSSDEIDVLITSGKKVSELALSWDERVDFSLSNEFKIKKIKPKAVIGELLEEEVGEDKDAYTAYVTSMFIMVEDFSQLIEDLLKE